MEIRHATPEDFDLAFDYIEKLWTYNTYDKSVIKKVYKEVLDNENDFAFSFLMRVSRWASAMEPFSIHSGFLVKPVMFPAL